MIKKLMLAVAVLAASMSCAFAQVDVNKADASALDGVKGVGPATSKLIIDARTKGGDFKDWADFEKRVKGMGDRRASKLSTASRWTARRWRLPIARPRLPARLQTRPPPSRPRAAKPWRRLLLPRLLLN
jgi:competence protein ComEA